MFRYLFNKLTFGKYLSDKIGPFLVIAFRISMDWNQHCPLRPRGLDYFHRVGRGGISWDISLILEAILSQMMLQIYKRVWEKISLKSCSVEGWLMICRDQWLTMGRWKNVCQHWIFYWHGLVPLKSRLFHRVLVSAAALHWAVIGIIGSVLRKWFHCNIEPFCVHIGFSHPDTHLSSGLSCHSLDKVAVLDWADGSKT